MAPTLIVEAEEVAKLAPPPDDVDAAAAEDDVDGGITTVEEVVEADIVKEGPDVDVEEVSET